MNEELLQTLITLMAWVESRDDGSFDLEHDPTIVETYRVIAKAEAATD